MKMDIAKVAEITFRLNLNAPPEYLALLKTKPEIIDDVANGVGSETEGIFYHLTPDTIWGLNINPASHIHDWMYTFPLLFGSVADGLAYKQLADHWFERNVRALINDGWAALRPLRRTRLNAYMKILSVSGVEAFWENKSLPPNYECYYDTLPDEDAAQMEKCRLIEQIIKNLSMT